MTILTNQLRIFQNGAKINSVKIHGGYRANRGVVAVFVVVDIVATGIAVVIRGRRDEPQQRRRNSLCRESGRDHQVMVMLLSLSA